MILTTDEIVTLTALCNFHIRSLTTLLRSGELSAGGREQYRLEIISTERLIEKLLQAAIDGATS